MTMSETRTCGTCGTTYTAHREESRYCSPDCYRAAYDAALSLAELERGRVFGTGTERRTRCPFCGDEKHSSDPDKLLALNADTGAWECKSCGAHGLLREHWTPPHVGSRPPGREARGRRFGRTSLAHAGARGHPRPAPAPAADPEEAAKREKLRALWGTTRPLAGTPGAKYLEGRGIALRVAQDGRARYAPDWYGRPAVVFPVQDAAGKLTGAEGRYIDGRADPKSRSAGRKSRGVFVAMPGALDAEGVCIVEGPITALSLAAAGFPAVALCGRTMPAWLPGRLAFRPVLIGLDWYEPNAEEKAAPMYRALVTLGATPYRLAPPADAGDWNDRLQAVGLDALRAELDAAVCGALVRLREA